jgi:hypothetical protein
MMARLVDGANMPLLTECEIYVGVIASKGALRNTRAQ